MSSLKALRSRIKSVNNTKKITATMKMVAAAKLRRARDTAEKTRAYAEALAQVLGRLATAQSGEEASLLLTGRATVKTVRLVVFATDRGLCGAFNTNILRAVAEFVKQQQAAGRTVQLQPIGNKAVDGLAARGLAKYLVHPQRDVTRQLGPRLAQAMAAGLVDDFTQGQCDAVYVLYNRFISALVQKPTQLGLLPAANAVTAAAEVATTAAALEYEPSAPEVLADVLPRFLAVQLLQAGQESQASEQGARMTAMDNATRNAGGMVKKLSLVYNRTRQANITRELIEIISGAEAIRG